MAPAPADGRELGAAAVGGHVHVIVVPLIEDEHPTHKGAKRRYPDVPRGVDWFTIKQGTTEFVLGVYGVEDLDWSALKIRRDVTIAYEATPEEMDATWEKVRALDATSGKTPQETRTAREEWDALVSQKRAIGDAVPVDVATPTEPPLGGG